MSSFNGEYLIVSTELGENGVSTHEAIASLNNLAAEIRGNNAVHCFHTISHGSYTLMIPSVDEHHVDVLKDLGYTCLRQKLSRQQRKKLKYKPLRIDNHGRYRKIL